MDCPTLPVTTPSPTQLRIVHVRCMRSSTSLRSPCLICYAFHHEPPIGFVSLGWFFFFCNVNISVHSLKRSKRQIHFHVNLYWWWWMGAGSALNHHLLLLWPFLELKEIQLHWFWPIALWLQPVHLNSAKMWAPVSLEELPPVDCSGSQPDPDLAKLINKVLCGECGVQISDDR